MANSRQTVLITGCSPGGIGHALALDFHKRNFLVIATARNPSTLTSLSTLGIHCLALSVHDSSSVTALADQVRSLTGGKLDFLINNAGQNYTVPALDIDIDELEEVFQANVFGVMRMCKAFSGMLVESKGTVVMMGSLAPVLRYVFSAGYNASKAALHAYSETLRQELAPFGVSVVLIIAGGVQSNLSRLHRDLPSDSLYLPLKEEYTKRLKFSQVHSVPTEDFVTRVVPQILQKRRTIWEGKASWLIWFLDNYLPFGRRIVEAFFFRNFSFWKLIPGKAKTS